MTFISCSCVVGKEIIPGIFIIEWLVRVGCERFYELVIDFRWIVIFVLLKRNNSREFCCFVVGTIDISMSLLPFFY